MKKILIIYIFLLSSPGQESQFKIREIPDFKILLESAINNSSSLKLQDELIAGKHANYSISKTKWLEFFVFGASVNIGTFNSEQLLNIDKSLAVGNRQSYSLNLGLKFDFHNLYTLSEQADIYQHQYKSEIIQKSLYKEKIREDLYQIYNELKLLREIINIEYENYTNSLIREKTAKTKFVNGEITLLEFSRLSDMVSKSKITFIQTYHNYNTCYQKLLRFCKMERN